MCHCFIYLSFSAPWSVGSIPASSSFNFQAACGLKFFTKFILYICNQTKTTLILYSSVSCSTSLIDQKQLRYHQIHSKLAASILLKVEENFKQKDNDILHWETNNNERNNNMINTPKEADFPLKQEALSTDHHEKSKASTSSSSQWLKLKDPRIVRVSRTFGGKDRHSKVCTIRGLRDRRVRLSVPTAIHLYDLQYRLGLNQPSKVVDWLLNAAKNEIDELPPLPIPPGNFTHGYPSLSTNCNDVSQNNIPLWKSKSKQVSGEMVSNKESWINRSEEEDKQGAQHVLPNNPSFLGLLNTMPLGYQLDPSSGDVAQFSNLGFVNQISDIHGINVVPFPSSLSLSTGSTTASQILVCSSGATQPCFPSHVVAGMEMDPRQTNHYQMLMSSGSQNNCINPSQHLMRMSTPRLFRSPN